MRRQVLRPLHFAWRYAWAGVEYAGTWMPAYRVARWWFDRLDRLHDRHAYPRGFGHPCVCHRQLSR